MKKVIFFLVFIVSFSHAGTSVWATAGTSPDYNPNTDRLIVSFTGSYPNYYQLKYATAYTGTFTSPSFCRCVSNGWYPSSDNSYYKCDTVEYLGFDDNYQCPSGQTIVNGSCVPLPPDADGDGTPDKCDYDHPNFANLDCDGDTIPNGTDDNIDGDDALNDNDLDSNNDGIPDSTQKGSPHYSANCQGADLSRDYVIQGVSYPKATYYSKGVMWISQCDALVNTTDIDSSFSAFDKNPECKAFYCFVHPVKPSCTYAPADYQPQGSSWTYKSGVDSEAKCSTYVDNVKYSSHHFAAPNLSDCPESTFCFLKRVDNAPAYVDQNMSENKTVDLNSTSQDLKPLLDAHNKTNEHLTDIKTQLVTSNKTLEDLKGVSNDILNKNESMDSSLKSLKSNSDKSLKNDLEALSTLGNIANATQKGNDINKAFSDVSTKNQVIGNEHLSSIDGKMNTNNALLTTINSSLSGDGTSPDTSVFDGFSSALSDSESFISSVNGQFSTFKGNIEGNLNDVMNQYNNTKSLLSSGQAPTMSGGGSLECASFNVFGQHVVLDLSFLSVLSPVFYYIFTAYFMFLNFSFLIRHLFVSGD